MSVATLISFVTAVTGLVLAGFVFGLGAAPGWKELRWFAALALTGGLYGVGDSLTSLEVSHAWAVWGSRFSLFVGGLHCCAWLLYMARQRRRPLLPAEKLLGAIMLAFGALALVPGVVISEEVQYHEVAWLGIRYNDALPTPFGAVCFASYCASFVLPLLRYGKAWRARETGAAAHVIGVAALFVAAVNDALAGAGLVNTPYLLSLAFLVLVAATAIGLVRRIVVSAATLDALSRNLEQAVEERTAALASTQRALLQAEKLAALGQLAAGLAHEINNPAFAIVCNLDYLKDHARHAGAMPPDAADVLDQSRSSMDRIVRIVRQLLDAAGATIDPAAAHERTLLGTCLDAAVQDARKLVPEAVAIAVDVPPDLAVAVPRAAVEQILGLLLVNSGQAIRSVRESGRIGVEAHAVDGRVVVTVKDDGPGIPAAVQPRVFEPFFSTKGPGGGVGLGLAVARGLVRSLGGELRLETTSAEGTVMVAELPRAG